MSDTTIISCPFDGKIPQELIASQYVPVTFNNILLFVFKFGLRTQVDLASRYLMGKKFNQGYKQRNPKQIELSFDYYPSDHDPVYQAIQKEEAVSIQVGSLTLGRGFVTQFGLRVTPDDLVMCSGRIEFLSTDIQSLRQKLLPIREWRVQQADVNKYYLAHGYGTILEQNLCNIPMNLTYEYTTNYVKELRIGEKEFTTMRNQYSQIRANLSAEHCESFVIFDGEQTKLSVQLRDICGKRLEQRHTNNLTAVNYLESPPYVCDGKIVRYSVDSATDDFLRGEIEIVQNV